MPVIPVQGDIQVTRRQGHLFPLLDLPLDPLCQKNAAGMDADDRKIGHTVVAFDNLQTDSIQAALDVPAHHNGPCRHAFTLFQK